MYDPKNPDAGDGGSLLQKSTPNKKARRSRAELVFETARSRSADHAKVQTLPSTRIEHGIAAGKPTLTAIFPTKGEGEPHRVDITFMLEVPGLTDLFAGGFLKCMMTNVHLTRDEIARTLRNSWFAFLHERRYTKILPADLDEQIMTAFNTWLRQAQKADGSAFQPMTIHKKLCALRRVLGESSMPHLVDLVPNGPRGAKHKTNPTEVLQFDQLLTVIAAIEKEVLALRNSWERGQSILMHGRELLRNGAVLVGNPRRYRVKAVEESNLALALAMIDQRYSGVIPDSDVIFADHSLLGRTVEAIGVETMTRYFYTSARELVPLALSIAIATVFNPSTVLKLNWKDIDRNVDPLSNGRRAVQFDVTQETNKVETSKEAEASGATESALTKITGAKPRAGRDLVRLLDPEASGINQVSLNMVLDLLIAITARIRPFVIEPERYSDRIFLFVPKARAKRSKGFGLPNGDVPGDLVWQKNLARFIKVNNLPEFTLKTIRATMLDYVQLFNRGDLEAARQVGNHSRRVTTWTHYTSNLVRRLLQEATGETMLVRERWLNSEGKIDPRKHREWASKGCATPGWICLDPFDSPRPNQKQGRLCSAYGECPDCPLSAARPVNPRNVMLYEALRRAIYRSISRVTPPVWQDRWAPVVVALDGLLANVPSQVLAESRRHIVELPDIG